MKNIANNIQEIIDEKGLKKYAVARMAGISGQKLSDMLAGRATIKAEHVPPLCKALGVDANRLLGLENKDQD